MRWVSESRRERESDGDAFPDRVGGGRRPKRFVGGANSDADLAEVAASVLAGLREKQSDDAAKESSSKSVTDFYSVFSA